MGIEGLISDEELTVCPECGCEFNDEGACIGCGLMLDHKIIVAEEPRAYDDYEKKRRKQNEPHKKGSSYWTCIGFNGCLNDYLNRGIKNTRLFGKLSKINKSSPNKKNVYDQLINFNKNLLENNIFNKQTIDTAEKIYNHAWSKKILKGRSVELLYTACIYTSLIINHEPRLLFDVVNECSNIYQKAIGKNNVLNILQLMNNLNVFSDLSYNLKKVKLRDYAITYCNKIKLPVRFTEKISLFINELEKKGLINGIDPAGVIASSIYFSLKRGYLSFDESKEVIDSLSLITKTKLKSVTQKSISDYMGISEVTMRNKYSLIKDYL